VRRGAPFDLAWGGWYAAYPDLHAMLSPILEDGFADPTLDDPVCQRELARAARLSGPERYLTYGELDLDIARNAAPLAAFGNLTPTTSSPPGSAARPTGPTAWTSPRSASDTPNADRHSAHRPRQPASTGSLLRTIRQIASSDARKRAALV
jgi:hypothetical protein